jgi:hypothetical protein
LKEFASTPDNVFGNGNWCPHCQVNKAVKAMTSAISAIEPTAVFATDEKLQCGERLLFVDIVVRFDGIEFFIESDGAQHFTADAMLRVMRKNPKTASSEQINAADAKFLDQCIRDRLKERTLRDDQKLLFRYSYRQLKEIPTLAQHMVDRARTWRNTCTGETVYMDPELYHTVLKL